MNIKYYINVNYIKNWKNIFLFKKLKINPKEFPYLTKNGKSWRTNTYLRLKMDIEM